jgi:hypothetical protein
MIGQHKWEARGDILRQRGIKDYCCVEHVCFLRLLDGSNKFATVTRFLHLRGVEFYFFPNLL